MPIMILGAAAAAISAGASGILALLAANEWRSAEPTSTTSSPAPRSTAPASTAPASTASRTLVTPAPARGLLPIERVDIPDSAGGYDFWRLRSDVAARARRVVAELAAAGARASSSGGLRPLTAEVVSTRSPTSLHYLGCALDLWVGGGMADPMRDPYIIERAPESGYWQVWARCRPGQGQRRTLDAVRAGRPPMRVAADVVDLTAIMRRHGLHRIRSRSDSWDGIARDNKLHGGTEWWHFELELPTGTRFGDELLRTYPRDKIEGTALWKRYAGYRFERGMFRAS